jgi:hypothetical protein
MKVRRNNLWYGKASGWITLALAVSLPAHYRNARCKAAERPGARTAECHSAQGHRGDPVKKTVNHLSDDWFRV